jgi:hypothetical protein
MKKRTMTIILLIIIWLLISFSYWIYLIDKNVQKDYPTLAKNSCGFDTLNLSLLNISLPELNLSISPYG